MNYVRVLVLSAPRFSQDASVQGYVEELSQLLTSTYEDFSEKQKALKSTEARLREVNLLIKNTGQYLGNKDVYKEYLASKEKKKFRESHRTKIYAMST